jgi:hypothetical protein
MNPRDREQAKRRRGLALALVTIHATLILTAWALANRQTGGLVRLKTYMAEREEQGGYREAAARRLAIGYALALLETGEPPPPDPAPPEGEAYTYECAVAIDPDPTSEVVAPRWYRVHFEKITTIDPQSDPPQDAGVAARWRVTVGEVSESTAEGLPRPARFPAPPPQAPPAGGGDP